MRIGSYAYLTVMNKMPWERGEGIHLVKTEYFKISLEYFKLTVG
jgi:hypothetical protein